LIRDIDPDPLRAARLTDRVATVAVAVTELNIRDNRRHLRLSRRWRAALNKRVVSSVFAAGTIR
jgi:hypothetical protein